MLRNRGSLRGSVSRGRYLPATRLCTHGMPAWAEERKRLIPKAEVACCGEEGFQVHTNTKAEKECVCVFVGGAGRAGKGV